MKRIALTLAVVAGAAGGLAAVEYAGNVEYLFNGLALRDTPVNPGNALGLPDISHLFEVRTRFSGGELLMLEWRGRYYSATNEATSHLDQAYVSFAPSRAARFRVGRQRIGFGPGYVWNPVNDLDKRRDIYNPAKYIEGVNAAKCVIDFSSRARKPLAWTIVAVAPEKVTGLGDLEFTGLGSQLYLLARDIEFGIAGSYAGNRGADSSSLLGAYGTIDIGGMILGLEYAVSRKPGLVFLSENGPSPIRDYRPRFLANLNRRVSESSFVLLEYFYNGFGYSDEEFETVAGLLRSSYADYGPLVIRTLAPGYVSKNYLFGTFSAEAADYWSFAVSAMANLDRPGAFLYPTVAWTGIDNVTLSLEAIANVTSGEESEFSLDVYRNILLVRAQYFF